MLGGGKARNAGAGALQEGQPWPPPHTSCEIREFDPTGIKGAGLPGAWKGLLAPDIVP